MRAARAACALFGVSFEAPAGGARTNGALVPYLLHFLSFCTCLRGDVDVSDVPLTGQACAQEFVVCPTGVQTAVNRARLRSAGPT
jgi:hypothetical protein